MSNVEMIEETAAMPQPVYVVDGGKGGVGKTFVAVALAETLLSTGRKIRVIDADDQNPSAARRLAKADHQVTLLPARNETEWMALLDNVYDHSEATIVDLPAGAGRWVEEANETVISGFEALGRPVHVIWVLSSTSADEGLQALASSMANITRIGRSLLVLLNGTNPDEFDIYRNSRLGRVIEGRQTADDLHLGAAKILADAKTRGMVTGSAFVPRMNSAVAEVLRNGQQGILAPIAGTTGLTLMQKTVASNWLKRFKADVADLQSKGLL